jgi:Spy/CpxP family protein refolding chaperone
MISLCFIATAQRPQGGGQSDKIRAMKVGVITQELNLSESQAEKFWPIYNNYSDERNEIFKEIRHLSKSGTHADSEEAIKKQDEILELRQKEITLTKKYRDSFLKVISAQQYAKLMDSERRFNQMLIEKLKERRQNN